MRHEDLYGKGNHTKRYAGFQSVELAIASVLHIFDWSRQGEDLLTVKPPLYIPLAPGVLSSEAEMIPPAACMHTSPVSKFQSSNKDLYERSFARAQLAVSYLMPPDRRRYSKVLSLSINIKIWKQITEQGEYSSAYRLCHTNALLPLLQQRRHLPYYSSHSRRREFPRSTRHSVIQEAVFSVYKSSL